MHKKYNRVGIEKYTKNWHKINESSRYPFIHPIHSSKPTCSLSSAIALIWTTPLLLSTSIFAAEISNIEEVLIVGSAEILTRLDEKNAAGSRLGLSAMETPASVELITKEDILVKGDYDLNSTITRSTGMSSTANPGNGGTAISVRGFTGQNSVTTTYDGSRLYIVAGTVTFPLDSWPIESVEVLRGAGSVVSGLGAIGATVNYIPKTPTPDTSSFDAMVTMGSFDMKRVALGGGADLNDEWAYRLDGAWQESASNVDRVNKERKVLAGSLLFHPSNTLNVRLNVDYADVHEDSPYFGTPLIHGEASDAHRENNYNFEDGLLDYQDLWARIKTDWELSSNVTFRNDTYVINSLRKWEGIEGFAYNEVSKLIDRDGYSYYGIVHDVQQAGTRSDFLIKSNIGGMDNKLTIGADINSVDLVYSNNWSGETFYANTSVSVFDGELDSWVDANIPTVKAFDTKTTQRGFFLDDALQITDQWSAVVGLRYDDIDYSRNDYARPGNGSVASSFDANYSEFGWRAGVVYQPITNMSIYAQVSQATEPVTSPATMSSGNKDFEPIRGRQYEVGLKQQLLDNRAEYTLALFDITKTNLVTSLTDSQFSEQIGSQSSKGAEASFRINPIDTLSLSLNATWVDAEFDEYYSSGVSLRGNTPRDVPQTTANAWLDWMPTDKLSMGAGIRYVGSRHEDNQNTREMPAYTVLDAMLTWRFSEKAAVTLRGRNLTDEKNYVLSSYGANKWIFGDPSNFEISFKYSL